MSKEFVQDALQVDLHFDDVLDEQGKVAGWALRVCVWESKDVCVRERGTGRGRIAHGQQESGH